MNRADVKERLSKCKTLVELVRDANALKKEGAHPNTVNKVVQEVRKELLKATASIKRVEKIQFRIEEPERYGRIAIQVRKIDDPCVFYDGGSALII